MAHADDGVLALAAQPQMPVVHQELDAVILGRDRIRIGLRHPLHHLQIFHVHLVAADSALLGANLAGDQDDDSWVRFLIVSNSASGSALFTATHCIRPDPSRTMGNTILPDLRRLYNHPAICTVSPACRPASAIVIRGALTDSPIDRILPRPSSARIPLLLSAPAERILVGARPQQVHRILPVHGPAFR